MPRRALPSFFRRITMPARVEFRHGSIFDELCDLLVIPSSAGGTVTPGVQKDLRTAGLPFPGAMPWGTITVLPSPNANYGAIAYAAAVSGQTSSAEMVEAIGRELGKIAAARRLGRIVAPILGAGSGDLEPTAAAAALIRGFVDTAPEAALLVFKVRAERTFEVLTGHRGPYALERAAPSLLKQIWEPVRARLQHPQRAKGSPVPDPPPHPPPLAQGIAASSPSSGGVPSVRTHVFISYSHVDVEWLKQLQRHLRPLERAGVVVWDDTRLKPGEPWREEIREALAETKVAILLISADFLASDFIVTDELPPLLKAAEEDGATILPVIISPCRFKRMDSLARFQAVNDPEKPLVQLRRGNREKVLDQVARAVEDALKG